MKRYILMLMCLLALPVIGVAAQAPTADLMATTDVYPAGETLFVISARTDDAFVATLDEALQPFYPLADEGELPPNFSLQMALDMLVQEAGLGTSFAEEVRPWLGDTASFAALLPPDCAADLAACNPDSALDDPGVIISIDLADRDLAVSTLEALAESNGVSVSGEEVGAYTVYSVPGEDTTLAFSAERLVISAPAVLDYYNILGGDFATVSASEDMTTTMGALPNADGYNALLYVNEPAFARTLSAFQAENATFENTELSDTLALVDFMGSIVFGGVILNDNTFAIDVAVALDVETPQLGSINPAFAENIPANVPLVAHATNLWGSYQFTLETIGTIAAEDPETNPEDIDTALALGDSLLQGFANLSIEDAFGWMTSDYALVTGMRDGVTDMMSAMESNPVEFGLIADASGDPAAAVNVVDGIESFVTGAFVSSLTERDDAEVSVNATREADTLTVTLESLTGELPFPLVMEVGVADGVFFLSTPGIAESVRAGGGLAQTPNFSQAESLLLPGSSSFYYVDVANLRALVDVIVAIDPSSEADLAEARPLLDLLAFATISTEYTADGYNRLRATLTTR